MNRFTQNMLNLGPRTDEELQGALTSFEQKWQSKVRRQLNDDNIVRL